MAVADYVFAEKLVEFPTSFFSDPTMSVMITVAMLVNHIWKTPQSISS